MQKIFISGLAVLTVLGCSAKGPTTISAANSASPEAFLKASMDKYEQKPGLAAKVEVDMKADPGTPSKSSRDFSYRAPNQYKVVSRLPSKFVLTSISNGKEVIDYTNEPNAPGQKTEAPAHLNESRSMLMQHPMFCGTLLYKFFGGSSNFDQLVDKTKGGVAFGKDVTVEGEPCKTVQFVATSTYGKTEIVIGKDSGNVYQITYDSAPLLEAMKAQDRSGGLNSLRAEIDKAKSPEEKAQLEAALRAAEKNPVPKSLTTTEHYSGLSDGKDLTEASFDVTPPKGLDVRDMTPNAKPVSPMPLGKPAPEFVVTGLDGKTAKLSALKGKVLLIDLWATWCGPCVYGLPETEKFAKASAGKNYVVMAISDEDNATVTKFVKEKGFKMPMYLDEGSKMRRAYRVNAIPTMMIIDAKGTLVNYFVGLQEPEVIREALKKAGANL